MELEVKHLAPYLPYSLKIQYIVRDKVEKTGYMRSISHNEDETHPTRVSINHNYEEHIWMFKPILRPMEDIKYYVEFLNKYNVDFDKKEGCLVKRKNENYTRLNELDFLFQNHFDVFGLIPKGLAVDINTLSVE